MNERQSKQMGNKSMKRAWANEAVGGSCGHGY